MKELNQKQLRFVSEYLKGGNATKAYIAAGYAPKNADSHSQHLLKNPIVAAAIAKVRNEIVEETGYDLRVSVKEIDRRLKMAEDAKQFSAVAKLQELKMKAHGLLVEKVDVRQTGFTLSIVGVRHLPQNGLPSPGDDDVFS